MCYLRASFTPYTNTKHMQPWEMSGGTLRSIHTNRFPHPSPTGSATYEVSYHAGWWLAILMGFIFPMYKEFLWKKSLWDSFCTWNLSSNNFLGQFWFVKFSHKKIWNCEFSWYLPCINELFKDRYIFIKI